MSGKHPHRDRDDSSQHTVKFCCPICRATQALHFSPRRGLYVLCDGCLGVLLIDELRTVEAPILGVRSVAQSDINEIPSDVYLAILAEKSIRWRERTQAGRFVRERGPVTSDQNRLELFQDDEKF